MPDEIEIPEVSLDDPRTKLQETVDLYKKRLDGIYEGLASIDRQILDLAEQKAAIEAVALPAVGGAGVYHSYVYEHLYQTVGKKGSYGIVEMIGKLQETQGFLKLDSTKYVYLIALYQAILDGDPLPDVPEVEEPGMEQCPDETDFHYCDRSEPPITLACTKGDTIMIKGKLYTAIKDYDPETEEWPEDWFEIWSCVGQQQSDYIGSDSDDALVHLKKSDYEHLMGSIETLSNDVATLLEGS